MPPPTYVSRPLPGHGPPDSDDDEPAESSSRPNLSNVQPNRPSRPDRSVRPSLNDRNDEHIARVPSNKRRPRPESYEDDDEHYDDFQEGSRDHSSQALAVLERPSQASRSPYTSSRSGGPQRGPNYNGEGAYGYYADQRSREDGALVRSTRRTATNPTQALVHAMAHKEAVTGSAGMTIFHSDGDDHNDIVAMPKYSAVPFSDLSAQNLEAIKEVFQVPEEKIETWCKLGRIERHNRTGKLRMDKVCALFDRHYAARWEERMEEDQVGITKANKGKAREKEAKEERERKRDKAVEERAAKRDKETEEREAKRDKEAKRKAKKAKAKAEEEAKKNQASTNGGGAVGVGGVVPMIPYPYYPPHWPSYAGWRHYW